MPTSAAPIINGTLGAFEQPPRYGVTESGAFLIRTWHGTLAACQALVLSILSSGGLYELREGIGTHILEARYSIPNGGFGGSEVPIDSWEFFANHVEKDVLETDNGYVAIVTQENLELIRNFIANPPGADADAIAATDFSDVEGDRDYAFALYNLMLSGVRSVRVNAPTLRHTQTVSNQYTVKASLTNVGKIISTATLGTLESIPTSVLFNLPSDTSSDARYAYGWMKSHPTIRVAARQKMQIELEYDYGKWSTFLYGDPI